jgi:hypothetical protein
MKDPAIEMVIDLVSEARRYVENAQTILKEHGNLDYETQLYQDRKYVRMASNTLWNGVLLILDAVFHVKKVGRPHPDVIDYRDEVAKRDKKLLALFNTAYETIHVYMGYDGNQSKASCMEGFRFANDIIDRCSRMLK